jgi:galactose mutarotase-like enzyme
MAALPHPLGVICTQLRATHSGDPALEAVDRSNCNAVSARINTLGAAVRSLAAPDRRGNPADIALSYARAQAYGSAGQLRAAARVAEPCCGRVLEIFTSAPGIQFCSGNFLNGSATRKSSIAYRSGDAIALAPRAFPATLNRCEFPSARLDPGATDDKVIVYRFSVEER